MARLLSGLLLIVVIFSIPQLVSGQLKIDNKKPVAWVGVVVGTTNAFDNKEMLGDPIATFSYPDKLVVLSQSSELARILLEDGTEAFVSTTAVNGFEAVTLKAATDKIKFFDRMREKEPWQSDYYDKQAAAWVALVARELGLVSGGVLPTPQEVETYIDTQPKLTVENSTSYVIRVYMTGPRTISRKINPGSSWIDDFPAGSYRVVAETTSGNVRPLKTTWDLKRSFQHTITLVIRTHRIG